jgi:hypothetical protein
MTSQQHNRLLSVGRSWLNYRLSLETVMAKSSELVDLFATQAPEASAQGETVILTAPVAFAGKPQQHGQIRLTLTFEQAERPSLCFHSSYRRYHKTLDN